MCSNSDGPTFDRTLSCTWRVYQTRQDQYSVSSLHSHSPWLWAEEHNYSTDHSRHPNLQLLRSIKKPKVIEKKDIMISPSRIRVVFILCSMINSFTVFYNQREGKPLPVSGTYTRIGHLYAPIQQNCFCNCFVCYPPWSTPCSWASEYSGTYHFHPLQYADWCSFQTLHTAGIELQSQSHMHVDSHEYFSIWE